MKLKDARTLSPTAQEALRYRAVEAVNQGMSKTEAARVFGVSRTAIHLWVKAYEADGRKALKAKKRGSPKRSALLPHQAATTVKLMSHNLPDHLGLPFCLWTREAVQQLLKQRYDLSVSVWTVGRYLKRWGFTPQKPLRRAYEQDPKAVQAWLDEEYPAIVEQAKQAGGEIHWGDQMGARSDYQAGRSYSRVGQTPVVDGTGARFGCNLMATLTNRGKVYFKLFTQNFNSEVLLDFLRRLIRQIPHKVFLIVDRHPVHLSKKVNRWLERHRDRIEMFLLPSYSPTLNPTELLNHDVKANALGRKRPRSKSELMRNLRSYLRKRQRQPDIVKRFFREKHVTYAAA